MAAVPKTRPSWSLKSLVPVTIFLGLAVAQSATVADFSLYPAGARTCLSSAATSSKCDQTSVASFNKCVCGNGGNFIDTSAACVGKSSASDLTAVYAVLSRNCADSNTPLSNYPLDKFLSQGSATTAAASASTKTVSSVTTVTRSGSVQVSTQLSTLVTSVAPSPILSTITIATTNSAGQTTGVATVLTLAPIQSITQSARPSTTSAAAGGSRGLSQGAAIGIGVGVGVPIALALFGILGVLLWRRRKSNANNLDNDKMSPHGNHASAATTLQSDSPYGQYAGVAAYKQSPSPSQAYPQNAPPYAQNPAYNYPQNGYGGMPAGSAQPVELSGTPIMPPQELPGDTRPGVNEKRPY